MQEEINIPEYLAEEFSMYLENMTSLSDPENPDLLANYLSNLFKQLQQTPLLFNGMVDQLAMAITTQIRINGKELTKAALNNEPSWADIKPFVGVHADARECITEIMTHAEENLKTAVLLVHFYSIYDATPLRAEKEEEDNSQDDYTNEYDENY